MIRLAFEGAEAEVVPAFWNREDRPPETITRLATKGESEPSPPPKASVEQAPLDLAPPWLVRPAPDEAVPPPPLRPSRLGAAGGAAQRKEGALHGTIVHELLQHLPDLPNAQRKAAGSAFLAARCYPEPKRKAALAAALGVLAHPDLAPLFAAGSRAEVPVSGCLQRADGSVRIVDGTIDRLAVSTESVVIADFKTGTIPVETPRGYLDQLALYRRVLQPLWPGRPARALLVWTEGPTLIWLDNSAPRCRGRGGARVMRIVVERVSQAGWCDAHGIGSSLSLRPEGQASSA